MVPLPPYIAHLQPNLLGGYSEFKREVGLYCGWGMDSTLWTSDQSAELGHDIQEAYRYCLYPSRIPDERVPHTWTFLEQTTTLTTTADDYDYTLPVDFGSFVGHYMMWGSGSAYDPPYMTNDTDILLRRSQSSTTGRPEMFAIRWAAQVAGSNQRREILFWPTPDAAYTITYKYAVLTGPLSESNPYPLGGPRMTQLMFEACRAVGEAKKNGQRGDRWVMFMQSLQDAIMLDKGTNTERTVGVMRGTESYAYERPIGTVSYYSGPDSSGNYTLVVS